MALSDVEKATIAYLQGKMADVVLADELNEAYYNGRQRLDQIGIAVPPELRRFETVVNWPRVTVDALEERIDKKALMLPGRDVAAPELEEAWAANDLDSEASLLHLDALVYGRGFACIGANEDDREHPLITVESPREVAVEVNPRTRRVTSALRLYGPDETGNPVELTLYLPGETIWATRTAEGWVEVDRDRHRIGRVPVIPFYNRRRTGPAAGLSEMADVITLTDSAARALTNLQVALETHAVPQKWVLGMSKGDFVDKDGKPIPVWQAYYSGIWANQNSDAKVGQFSASDLRNFHETISHYGGLVSSVTGLPMRYLGQNTANPPSADGIRADESRLVKRAERKCAAWGDQWGRVLAYYLRIRDGDWLDDARISVEWHDPGTPTIAARADAVQKLAGGKAILSLEGAWDELGWSEARKQREREYLAAEKAAQPTSPPPAPVEAPQDPLQDRTVAEEPETGDER